MGNYIWFQQAYCGMRRVVDSPCYWLVVSAVALRIYVSVGLQIVSVQFHLLILNKQFIFLLLRCLLYAIYILFLSIVFAFINIL